MNIKTKYFLPVLIFWFLSLNTNYRIDLYFEWIFGWGSIYSILDVYSNILHSFYIGCFSWSIVVYYLGTINKERFRRGIKSIVIFYPFWLGLSIFLSSIGSSSYSNSWLFFHILLRIWVGAGLLLSGIMVLNFTTSRIFKPILKDRLIRDAMEVEKEPSESNSSVYEFLGFLERNQLRVLVLITLILGVFFIVSSAMATGGINYLTSVYLFFTLIIINFLYDINYLFSKKKDAKHKIIQEQHITLKTSSPYTSNFDKLLYRFKKLIDEGNAYYTEESYELAIESWKEAVQIYSRFSNMVTQRKIIKVNLKTLNENLNNAYNGAVIVHLKNAQDAYTNLDLKTARQEWRAAIDDLNNILKLRISGKTREFRKEVMLKIEDITRNLKRSQVEIMIQKADDDLKTAHVTQDQELAKTIKSTEDIIQKYSNAKKKAHEFRIYKDYAEKIQHRLLNVRVFQEKLQEKLDKSMGIKPLEKRVKFDVDELSEFEIASVIKDEIVKQILSIVREFEFIGGQVRFKVGLVNNTNYPLTNFRITFDLPKSLKWIMHEPNYERKGDSILIPKLGAKEKRAVSLYFEPLNCMETHLNATISFFDVKDKPHAIPMKPKMITISCPIFFTEEDANLARVKSLRRNLTHRDKKVFPIIDSEKANSIFSSILSVLEQFDIKLISKEFFDENNFGEAWFFGVTKVKKERLVMNVLLDGDRKTLEFEVSGNNEEQITAFLAEIGDRVRQKLIENNIITSEEGFYDMRIAILSCLCPYCYTLMSSESVEKFSNGEIIVCENCCVNIKID
jgi:tetratricopeptide (TPR) repeat protein